MKRLLTPQAKWYRVLFFGVVFMVIPNLLQMTWDAYWKHYYQTADISNFYENVAVEASDVCFGDSKQHIESIRFVKGTDTGWPADIVRELYTVENNTVKSKVFDQYATVFIENVPDGKVSREADLPPLPVGIYKWEISLIKLYLPYGIIRVDSPRLLSNNFTVTECSK